MVGEHSRQREEYVGLSSQRCCAPRRDQTPRAARRPERQSHGQGFVLRHETGSHLHVMIQAGDSP